MKSTYVAFAAIVGLLCNMQVKFGGCEHFVADLSTGQVSNPIIQYHFAMNMTYKFNTKSTGWRSWF